MTQQPDGQYQYIGHICDHFAKFRTLFGLVTKEPGEVVQQLRQKYLGYFGLPKVIQSDNSSEFIDAIIKTSFSSFSSPAGHSVIGQLL